MVLLKRIVDELELKVRPVVVAIVNVELVPLRSQVPFPIFIVLVPVPLPLNPAAAESVTLLLFALKSSVPTYAPQVIDWTVTAPEFGPLTVQVAADPLVLDDPSKVTTSDEVGTALPPEPPEVVLQLPIFVEFHVPPEIVPPEVHA